MSATVQTAIPLDPPRNRKVSVWVRVDEMETPAHVELEVFNLATGAHRARFVGSASSTSGATKHTATGFNSMARLCAKLTEFAIWHASVEVNGTRYDLPRDTADRWGRLVELQALALGVKL